MFFLTLPAFPASRDHMFVHVIFTRELHVLILTVILASVEIFVAAGMFTRFIYVLATSQSNFKVFKSA